MTKPCNCGKETFNLRSDLDAALRNHRRRLHRNFMQAYWCIYAKGWHITGHPSKKIRGRR
jgi:hypothetical protein